MCGELVGSCTVNGEVGCKEKSGSIPAEHHLVVTYSKVLKEKGSTNYDAVLGAALVAGRAHVDRVGYVAVAHIVEIANVAGIAHDFEVVEGAADIEDVAGGGHSGGQVRDDHLEGVAAAVVSENSHLEAVAVAVA